MDVPTLIEGPLRKVNPAVRLVRARHLRRAAWELSNLAVRHPVHPDAPLRIGREFAEGLDIFPRSVTSGEEPELLLITDPHDRMIDDAPAADILRHYWERLFAAAVSDVCRGAVGEGGAGDRWEKLGTALARDAEFLLTTEHRVPDAPSREELYAAFAALFARTLCFRPSALPAVFPLADKEAVSAVIGADANVRQLLAETRPVGAADIRDQPLEHYPSRGTDTRPKGAEHEGRVARYAARGVAASAVGNDARAALLHRKAALASGTGAARHFKAAREAISDDLVPRLANVLDWDADTRDRWAKALQPLLVPAAAGIWPAGAKALYDLQKVAVDLERDLYAVDPAAWVRSLGRRPMVRKLTLGRQVVLLLHLKRVRRHLANTPLDERQRVALGGLLADEITVIDAKVRGEIGPTILAVFDRVGFVPAGPVEAVAREKVVQELLDVACERGQIRLGQLRDAVARNRLKLADPSGPGEFLRGDALLRADAELDRELDGVYIRGEVYLRTIQRGSALAFGTRVGRALSLYVLGPVIAAFLTVEFAKYIAHELSAVYRFVRSLVRYQDDNEALVNAVPDAAAPAKHGIAFGPDSMIAVAVLSVVVLGLIHSPPFRALVWRGVKLLWRLVVWVVTLPVTVWRSPPATAVRRHPNYRWVARRLGLAITFTIGATVFLLAFGASPDRTVRLAALTFAVTALFVNSMPGRWFTEETSEVLSDTWRQVRVNLLPNLFGWIVRLFREMLAAIDRMLYVVDEWLRFRAGQSRPSLWLKVAVGVVWFPVAYVLRFVIHLFVEPQINPVKHFPVVTVSHKLLLPLIPTLAPAMASAFQMSYDKAFGILTVIMGSIPGMFGFIAWELKENWRLYAANRPRRLVPVPLGHHGESMRGLLRPGFHSGTIPALYKKLRAAVKSSARSGEPAAAGKPLDGLHHVEEAVTEFVERELVALLQRADGWGEWKVAAGPVHLGLQSVTAEVVSGKLPHRPAVFTFTHRDGEISGAVTKPGFTDELPVGQREVWDTAVVGFLAMAAVPIPEADSRVGWDEWAAFWRTQTK